MREQMAKTMGVNPFQMLEVTSRRNMQVFMDAFRMFSPFPAATSSPAATDSPEARKAAPNSEGGIDEMRRQLAAMQARLDKMDGK